MELIRLAGTADPKLVAKDRRRAAAKDGPADDDDDLDITPAARHKRAWFRRKKEASNDFRGKASLLYLAIESGLDTEGLDLLINSGDAELKNLRHTNYESPLHLCIRLGRADIAKKLIEAEADPEVLGPSSYGALHYCARYGQVGIAAMLAERGANVSGNSKAPQSPLYVAARDGHPEVVEVLLKNNADIEVWDSALGYTALHVATRFGRADVIRTLLAHSANTEARDNEGHRPLHLAARHGAVEAARVLAGSPNVDLGARLGALAAVGGGWTALDLAEYYKMPEVSRILTDAAATRANASGTPAAVTEALPPGAAKYPATPAEPTE